MVMDLPNVYIYNTSPTLKAQRTSQNTGQKDCGARGPGWNVCCKILLSKDSKDAPRKSQKNDCQE